MVVSVQPTWTSDVALHHASYSDLAHHRGATGPRRRSRTHWSINFCTHPRCGGGRVWRGALQRKRPGRDAPGIRLLERPRPGWGRLGRSAALGIASAEPLVSALVDTSVLVDYLRGQPDAAELLERERAAAPLHASEMTRLEILAGMRPAEADRTQSLLSTLIWHPVDTSIAEEAGALGRRWLPSHHTIDGADLAIAATAIKTGSRLLTLNVRHFLMFTELSAPY